MEVIYPRNTRQDSASSGTVGSTVPVVDGGVVNNEFNDWLTQYFSEDNSKTIIETINNYAAEMPDIGVNDLIFAYMAKFESELKGIKEAIENGALNDALLLQHSVIDLGEFAWGDNIEHLYLLSGGVPASIALDDYISGECDLPVYGGEFNSPDSATGLINVSLYSLPYIENILSIPVLKIGADYYVPITVCDITQDDGSLGDNLGDTVQTDDNTYKEPIESTEENPIYFNYNYYAVDTGKIPSSAEWKFLTVMESNNWKAALGADPGGRLKDLSFADPNDGSHDIACFPAIPRGGDDLDNNNTLTYWLGQESDATHGYSASVDCNGTNITTHNEYKKSHRAIVLFRDLTAPEMALDDGAILDNYVGNDGKEYRVMKTPSYAVTYPLSETMYNDGTLITNIDEVDINITLTEAFSTVQDVPYQDTANGGVVTVSSDGLQISDINNDTTLSERVPVSSVSGSGSGRRVSPVVLRKI